MTNNTDLQNELADWLDDHNATIAVFGQLRSGAVVSLADLLPSGLDVVVRWHVVERQKDNGDD